jgi:hypothetical protein
MATWLGRYFFRAAFFFGAFLAVLFEADFFFVDFGAVARDELLPPKIRSQFDENLGVAPVRTIGPDIISSCLSLLSV